MELQILGMHNTNDFFFTFSHFDATSIQLLVGSRLFGYGCMNIIEPGNCSALRSTYSALCHAKSTNRLFHD